MCSDFFCVLFGDGHGHCGTSHLRLKLMVFCCTSFYQADDDPSKTWIYMVRRCTKYSHSLMFFSNSPWPTNRFMMFDLFLEKLWNQHFDFYWSTWWQQAKGSPSQVTLWWSNLVVEHPTISNLSLKMFWKTLKIHLTHTAESVELRWGHIE